MAWNLVRALVQAVKRNRERFPEDFMFQLSHAEFEHLKSQIVISSWGGLRRAMPYAFMEQGVAMLSSVLRSRRAIQVNVTIMRAFVNLRAMVTANKELADKLAELEQKVTGHDGHIRSLFEAIRQLMSQSATPGRRIGFEVKSEAAGTSGSRRHDWVKAMNDKMNHVHTLVPGRKRQAYSSHLGGPCTGCLSL